jgi:SAM-dependent MidA family methyltransferase
MSALAEIIRREIAERGVLSVARFMELALGCPNSGYYEAKKDSPGRRGDFYTSVSTGELFGQLLAFQFSAWLEKLRSAKREVRIAEAGAHDGRLAADILYWLQAHRPVLFQQIEYWIIEPSIRQQGWQKETLKDFTNVRWLSRFNDSTNQRFNGIIFSNELLDAMPVHRFSWDAKSKKWSEWGVAVEGEKFVWAKIPNSESPSAICHLPSSLLAVLPDDYTVEISPAAENWWRGAANALAGGKLLTIDYGLAADELFSPSRPHGTLRAYFRHHATNDVLANPGEQDLTAHVNFSAIQSAGESCGMKTETFSTQAQFLTRIAEKIFKNPKSFGEWGAKQNRQFQTLTHPEHLGRAFRVLIQSR